MIYDDEAETARAKQAAKDAKLLEAQRAEVLRQLMSTTAGRRWLHDLLAVCGVGRTPYTTDPYDTAFNCGQQNIGLRLLAESMSAAPGSYLEMMKENSNDRSLDDLESDSGAE